MWRALFGTLIQHTPLRGILDEFKMAGVTTVYRCSRVEDGRQIPTASVTVTFTRLTCLSKLIAWPLVRMVDPLELRLLHRQNSWRFGHTYRGCKPNLRCDKCGDSHDAQSCRSYTELCCLCKGAFGATYSNCPTRCCCWVAWSKRAQGWRRAGAVTRTKFKEKENFMYKYLHYRSQ